MLVINPNSPTGYLMNRSQMEDIIRFCVDNKLVLIASEVLQDVVHDKGISKKFISFREVINSMQEPYNKLELFSTHSVSKSNLFFPSARAGILDVMNIDEDVKKELYKHVSLDICCSIPGQLFLDLSLCPPCEEDKLFSKDFIKRYHDSIQISQAKNTLFMKRISQELKKSPHLEFYSPDAGFTFFINIPPNKKNRISNIASFYCQKLLQETEIITSEGSQFGKNFDNHFSLNMRYDINEEKIKALVYFTERFLEQKNLLL
jgi:alanine transaminase